MGDFNSKLGTRKEKSELLIGEYESRNHNDMLEFMNLPSLDGQTKNGVDYISTDK